MNNINHKQVNQSCYHGFNWLLSLLEENGGFKNINLFGAYYKAPLAFKIMESEKFRIVGAYITTNFGVNGSSLETNKTEQYLTYCPIYRLSWLLLGLKDINATSQIMLDEYFAHSNYENEFWNEDGEADVLSVSLIGLVGLYKGKISIALAAGAWISKAVSMQETESIFWIRFSKEWKIIKSNNQSNISWYKISKDQKSPKTYIAGIAAYFLTELFLNTKESSFIETAKRLYDYILSWESLSFRHPYSGKILLASCKLFYATRDKKYYTYIPEMIDYINNLQFNNSFWLLRDTYKSASEQPLEISIDRTSEYIIFLKSALKILEEI